jgi:hypothetical protein
MNIKLSSKQKAVLFLIKETCCLIAVAITIISCFKKPVGIEVQILDQALICYPVPTATAAKQLISP